MNFIDIKMKGTTINMIIRFVYAMRVCQPKETSHISLFQYSDFFFNLPLISNQETSLHRFLWANALSHLAVV